MDKNEELDGLKKVWSNLDEHYLLNYLVNGPQDPTLNLASVLTRHAVVRLVHECNPSSNVWCDSVSLRTQELDYAKKATRRLSVILQGRGLRKFCARAARKYKRVCGNKQQVAIRNNWRHFSDSLQSMQLIRPNVLECACGSANDYRVLHDYGIASLINYLGIDITEKNIRNAKSLFPTVDFRVGDASDTGFDSAKFDCVIVFDLFEHLSLGLMETALTEMIRIAERQLIITFFNMDEIGDHVDNPHPTKPYHWNTLSKTRLMSFLHQNRRVTGVEVLSLFSVEPVEFVFSGGYNSKNWLWNVYLSDG